MVATASAALLIGFERMKIVVAIVCDLARTKVSVFINVNPIRWKSQMLKFISFSILWWHYGKHLQAHSLNNRYATQTRSHTLSLALTLTIALTAAQIEFTIFFFMCLCIIFASYRDRPSSSLQYVPCILLFVLCSFFPYFPIRVRYYYHHHHRHHFFSSSFVDNVGNS